VTKKSSSTTSASHHNLGYVVELWADSTKDVNMRCQYEGICLLNDILLSLSAVRVVTSVISSTMWHVACHDGATDIPSCCSDRVAARLANGSSSLVDRSLLLEKAIRAQGCMWLAAAIGLGELGQPDHAFCAWPPCCPMQRKASPQLFPRSPSIIRIM
jgi:hypothetical protein